MHEICWFPDGQSEGRVILSSAHGDAVGEKLEPADLFDESMLSPERYAFHQTGLLRSIALSFAKRGDFIKAREIISKGIDRFNAQPAAKEMPGGRSVSPQELDADEWVLTLSMELGLDFALNDFEAALPHFERLEKFVSKPPKFCSNCEYTRTMLPLYRWLFDFERAAASGGALPELPAVEGKNVWGHNPVEVVKLLKQPASSPASKSDHAQYEFWIAVRCLMNGVSRGAVESFRNFLESDRASYSPFEGMVAAKRSRG